MKICGVEEAEMNKGAVYAAYAYLAYVETNLEDFEDEQRPISPPPPPPLSKDRALCLPVPRTSTLVFSDSARPPQLYRPCKTPSFSRQQHDDRTSWEEACPGIRLDFLTHLPPEVSVYILRYLHPRFLCRVVQVSRRWRWLAQYNCLRTRRLRYIQRKREKYLQSKENVVPGHRLTQTPQTLTRPLLLTETHRSSPLAPIQVSSSRQRHARQTRLNSPYGGRMIQDEDTPVQSYRNGRSLRRSARHQATQSPVLNTPENGSRHVRRAIDEDSSYIVRRCLFPHSPSLTQPTQPRRRSMTSPDDDSFTGFDANLSVKKSASRRRLKRL